MSLTHWAVLLIGVMGCRTDSKVAEEKADAIVEPAEHTSVPADAPAGAPSPWSSGLQAALAQAIVPPENDDATYRVDPFVAALVFEELRALGGGSTVQKYTSDGKDGKPAAGYQLSGVVKDSLFDRLGLRDGDIIEALNGVVLTGPDRIGFALDGAENAVALTVHRDGVSFTISYRLAGGLAWRNLLAQYTGDADPGAGVDAPVVAAADDAGEIPPAEGGAADGEMPAEPAPDDGGAEPVPGGEPSEPAGEGGREPHTPTPSGTKPTPSGTKPSGTKPSGTKPSTPSGTKPSKPSTTKGVSCESSSRCTIDKDLFDDMVASPQRLSSQAKVVPAIRNDVFSGYKLSYVKPGSAVSALGFQSGDKITHVNGRDLTDDIQAMALYMSLSSTRVFKIRYERGTSKLVKTVTVS